MSAVPLPHPRSTADGVRRTLAAALLVSVAMGPDTSPGAAEPSGAADSETSDDGLPRNVDDRPSLANLVRVTEVIRSGAEPKGKTGFASLDKMGVRTVVSVDAAHSTAATARRPRAPSARSADNASGAIAAIETRPASRP